MLCPSCKTEIPEGKMYCPSCGHAIQIVPDFEPDIEEQIELSRSDIEVVMTDTNAVENAGKKAGDTIETGNGENGGETKEIVISDDRETDTSAIDRIIERQKERAAKKISLRIRVLSAIALIVAGTVIFVTVKNILSDRYSIHMQEAVDLMAKDQYDAAYEEYLTASKKENITDEDRHKASLGAANAAFLAERNEDAVELLNDILAEDPEKTDAYEQLIRIYETEGDTVAINDLIASCPVSEIYEKYKDYIILPPEFSEKGGEFEEDVTVLLTAADGVSDIYYTLDGKEPDENSKKYTEPVVLGEGDHIISAVCVNKKGYLSPVVSEEYVITYIRPDSPEIEPPEGSKSVPGNITASAPEGTRIYYTTDGSDPDTDSILYEGEIPMPLGKSRFKFVSVDEKGNMSEPTEVSYNLNMAAAFTPADGINYLIVTLVGNGTLLDTQGHAPSVTGTYGYECNSCYSSGSRIYYMIYETYENGAKPESTGNIYALDFKTLELYRAKRGDDGNFTFEMFY